MHIYVPVYDGKKFEFIWEDDFSIKCSIENACVCIEANAEGLISLARHLLELSQANVPDFTHFHLDEFNSLEDGSIELLIVKKSQANGEAVL